MASSPQGDPTLPDFPYCEENIAGTGLLLTPRERDEENLSLMPEIWRFQTLGVVDFREDVPTSLREPTVPTEQRSLFARLTSHIPPAQFSRYTLVGIWNTIFGYGSYAALTALFMPRMAHGYLVAAVLSGLVSISVAFLGYKWFVFKTKGNYLREWLRCHVVYGTAAAIGVIVLPAFVYGFKRFVGLEASAPYVAGATVTGLNVIVSFLGHRNFSFRRD